MGLFDDKKHITKEELHKALKKEHELSKEERLKIEKMAKKAKGYYGLSEKNWNEKVVKRLEKDKKDGIDLKEVKRLKEL